MTDTEIPLPRPRKGGGGIKHADIIISWRPFIANALDGKSEYRFSCPRCKGRNAVKAPHSSGHHFLEGHYQCTDCGLTEYEQVFMGKAETYPITYYSDCFERVKEQSSLFEL